MPDLPDLVDIHAASAIAERSETTIRRWIRDGHLTRHEAPAPPHGGSPAVLVSSRELLAHLVTIGQQPKPDDDDPGDHPGDDPTDTHRDTMAIRLAVLEAEAVLRAEISTLRVAEAGLRAALDAAEGRATRAEVELVGARVERDDWRARHDARAAELAALRSLASPWWRRMLGG